MRLLPGNRRKSICACSNAYTDRPKTTRFYDIDCMDASELLLVTGNYIYLAQKSALAQKSTYFKRAFEGKFPVIDSPFLRASQMTALANDGM